MARFKGHLGNNMVVLYLIYILNAIVSSQSEESVVWYMGCYTVSPPGVYQNEIKVIDHPVECSRHCFDRSYAYTVVLKGNQCGCLNDTSLKSSQLPDDSCTMRCGQYPCGGANDEASVYLSAGPFLQNVTCHVMERPIYTDQDFAVEVDIQLASLPNVSIGVSDLGFPGHPERIAISWTLNSSDPHQENITLSGPYVRYALIHTIASAGVYLIDIEVSNILSILRISTNVTVLLPEPSLLQLTLVTGKDQLPSCVPGDVQLEEGKKAIAVFTGDPIIFETTIAVGYNITFEWFFSDDDTRRVENPTLDACKGRQCTTSIQDHVFANVGQFMATVNASNSLGNLQDSIYVMVVRRELTNLVFIVHKDSPTVAEPNTPLRFLVAMETTARHEVTLQVTFGDGSKKEYKLSGSFLYSKAEDEGDSLLLLSNYTDGNCSLNFELQHTYTTQGEFQPKLTVLSNFTSDKVLQLDQVIKIINRLTPPDLTGPAAVAVNRVVNLSAASMRNTPNVTYYWSVVDEEQLEEHNITTKMPTLSHKFTKPGLFTVHMKAKNAINSVRVSIRINVLYPVSDLSISSVPEHILRTGEQASFSAELDAGTMVEYEWDFSDPGLNTLMGQQNLSAYANHTFLNAGSYNISVQAYNAVSRLTAYLDNLMIVQDPVGDLDVVCDSTVLNNTNVTLIVTASSGTDVMVSVDFGQGPEYYGKMNGQSLNFVKVFTEVQEHQVNVTAFNNASSLTKSVMVDVQKDIGIINVSLPSKSTVTEPVIFAVYDGGDLSKRNDLVYTWLINGTVVSRTRVPVIDKLFTKTGLYNVTVLAENDVANASAMQPVIVEADESNTRFANPSVAVFNETTRLMLKNLPDGLLEIRVKYGDGAEKTYSDIDADNLTLEYVFPDARVYEVAAIIYLGSRRQTDVATVIAIQEPLQGLLLSGPSAVPLNRSSVEFTWTAEVGRGSHILFEWFINNELIVATTRAKLTWRFRHAGMYNISVRASNSLGSLTANSSVAVEYSISRVQLQVPPTVRGRAAQLVLIVRGGPHVNFSISYGDGKTILLSSTDLSSENLTTPTDVVHRYNLPYNYSQVGIYEVSVNVSNHVSYMLETSRATVEEPIEGVVLTSFSPRVVELGQSVTVSVSIASGNDLVCDWDFSDENRPPPNMNCSNSQTTHTFSRPGNYTVRVLVSNNLYDDPVEAVLHGQFTVVQKIKGLSIRQQEDKSVVMLVRGQGGENTTRQTAFVASVEEGSDITYTFHYGDGSVEEVRPGTGNEAIGKHSFTSEKAYNITVSGRNLLSNVTVSLGHLFHVQVMLIGLQLDKKLYAVALGNSTTFRASLQNGSNVVYAWDMGDGTLHKDTGPLVEHRYLKVGSFSVTLTASNLLGHLSARAKVDVTEPLQGVHLRVNVTMAAVDTAIRFTAEPYPMNVSVFYYKWDFQTNDYETTKRTWDHKYKVQGNHSVRVNATGLYRTQVSNLVIVYIVEPLTPVAMSVSGEQLINHTLEFMAKHYKGSDVKYVWNFGDGTEDRESDETRVLYTYYRTGEFNVVVTAKNPLGNYSASTPVFILKRPCRPPTISILSTPGGQVYRSADLKVEAEVVINCTITPKAKHRWFLKKSDSRQEMQPTSPFPGSQHDAIFYLPPRSLEYGNYTLSLTPDSQELQAHVVDFYSPAHSKLSAYEGAEVEMFETSPRVYSTASTHFEVIKAPLLAVISGGIKRHASRQEDVLLDASTSSDPDNPSDRNFTYVWSCYQLNSRDKSCFHGNKTMASWVGSKQNVVTVPGSAFSVAVDDFVVNMTLSMKGRQPLNTSQVLTMQQQRLINVEVSCRECHDHVINSDQKITLYAEHPGVGEEDVKYEWQVYKISDDRSDSATAHEGGTCIPTDQYRYLELNHVQGRNIVSDSIGSPTSSLGPQDVHTSTTSSTRNSGGRGSAVGERFGESFNFPSFPEDSGGGNSARGSSSMGEGLPPIGEAPPGVAGSAAGRRQGVNPPVGPSEGSTGGRNTANSGTRPSADQKEGDEATDAIIQPEAVGHIVNRLRYPIIIKNEDTSTGLNQRALVINKGVLKQGTTYVVEVKVSGKEDTRVGTVMEYFVVNKSPSKGECDMRPHDEGIEMETEFRIYCTGWKDSDQPIHYEVSYRFGDEEERQVVYMGLNHLVIFQLPAGFAHYNYTVEVFISILDSLGARTQVCSLPITVRPRSFDALNKTEEQILYDIVKGDESPLQIYVSSGDNRNVRLQTQLVAHRLNRLNATGEDDQQRNMRRQIREAMLEALHDLPMRDEYEVQQTTAAVASSTAVTNELEVSSLVIASDILEKAVRQVETLASRGKQLDTTNIASLTIDGAANILAAVTTADVAEQLERDLTTPSPLSYEIEYEAPNQVKEVVEKSRHAVHTVLKSEMQQWVVGERVFTKDTGNLLTEAGRFRASRAYTSQSQLTNFVLPSNMQHVLNSNVKLKQGLLVDSSSMEEDCYQAHMLTFRNNPYIYSKNRKRKVQTQVASLTLFTCDGQELSVDGLPPDDLVNMHIPHQELNSQTMMSDLLILEKHHMNVHQFNVSETNSGQSLHIHVQLEPAKDKHVFPISILVSGDEPPNPENYFIQRNFGRELDNLKVYIEAKELRAGKQYYIGLVDVEYNAGRPRAGEVTQRQYRLWLWWGDCLYWKEADNEWSTDGCHISPAANFSHIQCNCNHLTSFGAHFSLAPNDLSFTDVEAFIDLHENPVTFVFVLCIFALYFVFLVISIKLDRHDAMKGSIVHLVDNKANDKQTYMVTLETGFRKGAGTTAKVSLVLHGEQGMSEMRELVSESGQLLFERNSRDTFIVTLRESLGKVWKVQLWHNNAGPSPSWYLSRVTVKDLTADHTYYFSCEKWFAVEEDDGKIEREIMLQEGGLGFGKVLWAKGTQYFADFHLWLSFFSRPSYSRFTRAQRLTCALSLILSYMAVNAAWYQYNEKEYRGEFGLIDISWRSVFVGIITAVLVLPVNFIIILIFRRSKVNKVRLEEFPKKKHFANKRDSLSSLDSTVRLLQPVVTQSIFDQSMINWQNLQEWAQRQWAKRYQQSVNSSLQNVKPPNPQQVQMADAVPPNAPLSDTHANATANDAPPPDSDLAASPTDAVDLASVLPEVADSAAGSNRSSTSLSPPFHRSGRGQEDQARPGDIGGQPREPLLRNRSTHSEPSGHSSNNSFFVATSAEGSSLHPQQLLLMQGGGIRFLRSEKKERCFLPCWCIHIAWFLCVVIILGCATITILYGFRFGRAKSIMWLQSLFFSFIQCVFITHPFIILIISVVTAIRYHDDLTVFDHHNDGVIETFQGVVNNDESPPPYTEKAEEFDLATGIAERQRSRYLRFARPPQEKHLIEARKTTLKQKKTGAVFSETVSFSILLFLLLVVAFGKDSQTPFQLNSTLETLLAKTGSMPFKDIQTVDQWWQWSQSDLMTTLHGEGQESRIIVGNSQLVGQVSVRQKRVRPSMCGLPGAYSQYATCHKGYSRSTSETSWFTVDNFTMPYKEKDQTGASCIMGRFAQYDSAGHQVFLPTDRKGAVAMLEDLYNYEWLGLQTRAVIVEFVLFHAPSNLFSSVHLVLEIPPVGRAFPYTDITSAYVYKYISHFDNFILACELLLIIFTMILLHSEVESAIRMKKEYIKSPWNCIQVTVLCLLMAYIACYLYRYVVVGNVVNALRSSYNSEYVDTSFIAYWDHLLNSFLGFIIFLLLVQSLRLLRNQPLFTKFSAIYRKTVYEIITFGGLFLVWACAYTSLGVALYSAVSLDFSQWDKGLGTVVGLMTRYYDMEDLEEVDPSGIRLLVISFLLLALSSLTAYIVAVLIYHLKRHHSSGLPPLSTSQALRYLWSRLLMFAQLRQPRCVHEDDGGLPPEFTMAEIEYQVEEMLFKMNALAGTSGLPDKPSQYFTDSDCTYPSPGEDAVSSGSEPRFDDGRFERRINKIEDNLVTFEPHLAKLLQLDAIGAHILTAEHEKQLRSQLELEIFRRLQLQRPDVRPHHANCLPSSSSNNSKVQASSNSSGCQASAEASPSTASPPGHAHKSFFLPAKAGGADKKEGRGTKAQGGNSSRSKPTQLPSSERSHDRVKMSDGLILQDLSEKSSGCQDAAIPLQEIKRPAPVTPEKTPPGVTRRSHEDHASGSSCSSGAAEIQYVLNLKKAKEMAKDSIALTGIKQKPKLLVDNSAVYDALNDSSSGSGGEIAPAKARSLRKTKSRGKGKGRQGHTDGFDDFAFDNHAFNYGSDRENKKYSTIKRKHPLKQAWM